MLTSGGNADDHSCNNVGAHSSEAHDSNAGEVRTRSAAQRLHAAAVLPILADDGGNIHMRVRADGPSVAHWLRC